MTGERPARMEILHKNIPQEMKDKKQWCLWRWELRDGRWTKPPYTPKGGPAKSNDPSSWVTHEEACFALPHFDGLGFMFGNGNGYVGLDWDNARDPETGRARDWVKRHLKEINSCTEVSPSGRGFKTIVKASIPKDHHGESIGLFSKTRYFCVTGHVLTEYSPNIEPRQAQIDKLIQEYWPQDVQTETQAKPEPQANNASDDEILQKAMETDPKFQRLFRGNWGDYTSQSEADLALWCKLAFWFGKDAQRIGSVFRRSGLMRPKFDREDYAKRTIDKAMALVDEMYQVKPANVTRNTEKTNPAGVGTIPDRVSEVNVYTPQRMVDEYRLYIKSLEKMRFVTGIREVDKVIRGVASGEVLTLLARAGCFKTTMLQHLLMRYAQNSQWSALFFSLEMPVQSVAERYLQIIGGQTGREIEGYYKRGGTGDVVTNLERVFIEDLKGLYTVPVKVSLEDVKAYVKLVETRYSVKVGVIGIDYLGLLDEPGKNEYEIVSRLARDIKGLAKELSLPIVLLAQTSRRAGSGEIEISMDMARGSGAIEESADFCLGLFHAEHKRLSVEVDEPQFEVILKVLKNRKGPKGMMFKLDLDQKTLRLGNTAELWTQEKKGKVNNL